MSRKSKMDRLYSTSQWKRLRLQILERDGWTCQIRRKGCERVARTVDHKIPVVDGGSFWDEVNLRAACRRCNFGAGAALINRKRARAAAMLERGELPYEARPPECRSYPHVKAGEPPCSKCGQVGPSRDW